MAEKMTYINPEMLIWAREESCTLIDEVIEKFGSEKVTAWENGTNYPTYKQLKDLGNIYRKPVAVFFFPAPPVMKNIVTSCRTLPKDMGMMFTRNIKRLMDEARIMQINLYELNENKNEKINKIVREEFNCFDIKSTAAKLRKIMNVSLEEQNKLKKYDTAFEFWREKFYQIGIYVFKDAFKDERISGFCLYDKEFPVVYINNSFSFARQIFTLFHEIFHILYKTSGIDIFNDSNGCSYYNEADELIEINCNKFAGEFLVPDVEFDSRIRGKIFNEKIIEQLANTFCVSREVILRKFLDKKVIDKEYYNELRNAYLEDYKRITEINDSKESRGNYYNTQMSYKGERYVRLTYGCYYNNKITIMQLSQYMNMKIPSLKVIAQKKGWGAL
ncbi:ImmA/IrrE family metallo-endopeptidase [Anaerocolumna sp. AGMB13025]|uniref:ImmA/IrrE family metallo-endopeptidase n=1 Tax=Anaerocolumna sp. AGMB13025 TaxID=3039116 RepID=UPI00241E9E9F|nr:ImmA/IrrE family metallo-endopeptidase [Anaerocolumna sp. AGMB13025]WFR57622.1 ImmA/IrrE family metallo-endopeptidase [Anaerocolumna sp. AGMB13025]